MLFHSIQQSNQTQLFATFSITSSSPDLVHLHSSSYVIVLLTLQALAPSHLTHNRVLAHVNSLSYKLLPNFLPSRFQIFRWNHSRKHIVYWHRFYSNTHTHVYKLHEIILTFIICNITLMFFFIFLLAKTLAAIY